MGRRKDLLKDKPEPASMRDYRRKRRAFIKKFQTDSEEMDGYYDEEELILIESEPEDE